MSSGRSLSSTVTALSFHLKQFSDGSSNQSRDGYLALVYRNLKEKLQYENRNCDGNDQFFPLDCIVIILLDQVQCIFGCEKNLLRIWVGFDRSYNQLQSVIHETLNLWNRFLYSVDNRLDKVHLGESTEKYTNWRVYSNTQAIFGPALRTSGAAASA